MGTCVQGFLKKRKKFSTDPEDEVRINPDGVASLNLVNEAVYHSPVDFTLGVVVLVFDLEVIFDEEKPGSSLEFHVDDSWMTI
ncbi:hypothetical protein Tco_0336128 [Tanacetum coccineum]